MSRFLPYVLLFALMVAKVVEAQSVSPVKPEIKKQASIDYQAVVPGSGNPPAVKFAPGCVPTRATWLGFQMLKEGGSRFFLQLTSEAEVNYTPKCTAVVNASLANNEFCTSKGGERKHITT